jgi:hypothetical protein
MKQKTVLDSPPTKKKFAFNRYLLVAIIILLTALGTVLIKNNPKTENFREEDEKQDKGETNFERLICDRTSRLDNDEGIDRALSLISERLRYSSGKDPFPPQLINCIKVEAKNIKNDTGNIKNDTGAEGYFDESNENIQSNYFPIVIDDWGNFFADDLSTALLLVHEITHVQQYIDRYNLIVDPTDSEIFNTLSKMSKSKCLDNEVFAYRNQLLFTLRLKEEERKSIDYRIFADDNLIPQLEILKSLKYSLADLSINNSCEIYDTDCINSQIHTKIYDLLRDGGAYDEQCSAYEGTFIGE